MVDKKRLILIFGNVFFVILTIIINALANILPINNRYTGELADLYPNLFVPTGLTFAIWGVIYVLLLMFALYLIKDLLIKEEKKDVSYIEKIGVFFILASIGNIIWIFLWHYEKVFLSLLPMLLLFFSLLMIYLRLDIGRKKVSIKEKIFVHLPFSVYFGWITVATVANVTAILVDIDWDGFSISPEIWTILIISIVVLLTILVLITRFDVAYSLVIIWALFGIYLKRINDDPVFGVKENIAYTSLIGIALIFITILFSLLYKKKLILKQKK